MPHAAGADTGAGFTLLELVVALFITGLSVGLAVPACGAVLSDQALVSTTVDLLAHLRYAQTAGQALDSYGWVRMSKYTPTYTTLISSVPVDTVQFASGVNYVDGYLELGTGSLMYDNLGNGQVGGVIRLTNGRAERDIDLYIGCGLQAAAWGDEP
jgi:Tfp pilus assembly protein FimT